MQLSSPTSPLFSLSACSPWSARSLFSTSSQPKSHCPNFPQITFYILQGLFYSTIPYSAFQVLSIDERCFEYFLTFADFQVPLLISFLSLLGLVVLLICGDSDGW